MSEVRLENVSKVYSNGVIALRAVEFTVLDRECLVIVGPSGSGKTTLLRIIAGLEMPTKGEVVIDGECMTLSPVAERNVAMVFQDDTLYPHRSVEGNLSFGLQMRRMISAYHSESATHLTPKSIDSESLSMNLGKKMMI